MRVHTGDLGLQTHPKDFCSVVGWSVLVRVMYIARQFGMPSFLDAPCSHCHADRSNEKDGCCHGPWRSLTPARVGRG